MFKNLKIIGTSHISKNSVEDIRGCFRSYKPDIVAVELDRQRLISLMNDEKGSISLSSIRRIGVAGFIFVIIGRYVQKKLGSIVDMQPGSDMKEAVDLARAENKELLLMDRDIQITLRRFSKAFSWKEKFQLMKDILLSPFQKKQRIHFDLNSVPSEEIIESLLGQLKQRYPGLYRALIEERNKFMARRIFLTMKKFPEKKILCVMGAGHHKGFVEDLKKLYYSNPTVS